MVERAGRAGFVPVSLHLQDATPAVPGRGLTGIDAEQAVPIPDSPALICDSGVVVQANLAAARLAGRRRPELLIGLSLDCLLVDDGADGADAELIGPDGRATPVRVVRWRVPDTDLLMVFLVDVSDLCSAGDALRTERRRLAEVERVAGIGSWEFDPVTGSTRWSPAYYGILGIEPGTAVSGMDTVLGMVHPQDRDRLADLWKEHLQTGEPIDTEYRLIRPDGAVRTIQARAESQYDQQGRPIRYTGCIWDVTEQRQKDSELTQQRAQLLEAQRIARIGSFSWDWPTGKLSYSPALAELFAAHCMDLTVDLTNPFRLIHPEDLPALVEQVEALVANPELGTVEGEFRGQAHVPADIADASGDGQIRYVCRLRIDRSDPEGTPRLVGTVQDVTEARALEHELREERRRLAEAQRVARIGTWEWDQDSDRAVWSDVLQELYGVTELRAPTYQTYLSLVHPDDRDWVDELWQQMLVDHQSVECEHRVLRPDGKVRLLRCHGAVMVEPSGSLRLVGTAQDVTEQRATESRMERSSQRFADLVAITPVGIGLFDSADRLVDANDALCTLLGYNLTTLRGREFELFIHPDEVGDRLPLGAYAYQDTYQGAHQSAGSTNYPTGHVTGYPASHPTKYPTTYPVPQRMLRRADGAPVHCELHVSVSVQDDGQRFLLVVFADVTERHRVAEELQHKATHDELTDLPNRAAIKDTLADLLAVPDRDLAVLFCDIDNFKRVNDSLGHDAGDELLVALARRLTDGLPEHCVAARLSGDVYVVICSRVSDHGGIRALVNTVSELLRTAIPVHGQLVRVSAAIGVAVPDSSTRSPEDLLRFADAALSQAKRQCTGQIVLANAALIASADRQVELECQLREALLHDGLQLHYQPVVGADGVVRTAEALVRWPHPERGMLAPEVFLPVAEQGDLTRELDLWVLRTALRAARDWVTPDGHPVAVAVNLGGLMPGEPDFVTTVADAVAESGLPWNRVVLELVETALMDLPSRIRQAMAQLVERGVRFAVDDFGTGYSSLARLKELPAQIVKVDRRFVSGVAADPSDFAVARAVVDMAKAMGRCCIAEGVETATQFHVLRELGVDAYQGWLFSRPIPQPEFCALLSLGPLPIPR